jgi:hypothetical protein
MIVGSLSAPILEIAPTEATHTTVQYRGGPSATTLEIGAGSSATFTSASALIASGGGNYATISNTSIDLYAPDVYTIDAKLWISASGFNDTCLTRSGVSTLRLSSNGTTGAATLDIRGSLQMAGTSCITSARDATLNSLGVNITAAPATGLILVQYSSASVLGIQADYTNGAVGASMITANASGYAGADQILFRGRSTATNRFLVYANGDIDFSGILKMGGTTVISAARAASNLTGLTMSSGTVTLAASTTGGPSLSIPTGTAPSAPASGNFWHDSTRKALLSYTNAALGVVDRTIYSQYAAVTQAGIVTNQSLASGSSIGSRTLPANFLNVLGKRLRYYLCGYYTTDAVPGNAEIRIRLGSTTFRTTGTYALDANITNGWWRLMGEFTCFSTGATGTVNGMMAWEHQSSTVAGAEVVHLQAANAVTAVTVDLTASQAFDVEWTASDAGTTLVCTCYCLTEVA